MTIDRFIRRLMFLTTVSMLVAVVLIGIGDYGPGVVALWFVALGCATMLGLATWADR